MELKLGEFSDPKKEIYRGHHPNGAWKYNNGQMVISLKEVDNTFDFLGPFIDEIQLSIEKAKNRIPLSNIVFFTRQLATMFSAGLTLERAIQSLGVEEKHRKFQKVLNLTCTV